MPIARIEYLYNILHKKGIPANISKIIEHSGLIQERILDAYEIFKDKEFHIAMEYKKIRDPEYSEEDFYVAYLFKEIYMKDELFVYKLRKCDGDGYKYGDLYKEIMEETNLPEFGLTPEITNYYTYDIFSYRVNEKKASSKKIFSGKNRKEKTKLIQNIETHFHKFKDVKEFLESCYKGIPPKPTEKTYFTQLDMREDKLLFEYFHALTSIPKDVFTAYERYTALRNNPEDKLYKTLRKVREVDNRELMKEIFENIAYYNSPEYLVKIYMLKPELFYERIKDMSDKEAEPIMRGLLRLKAKPENAGIDKKISEKFPEVIAMVGRKNIPRKS